MNKKFLIFFVLAAFLAASALADFSYKNSNIIRQYAEGDIIRGFVNMSFDEQNANSIFTSNFNGDITLIEFLEKNNFAEGDDYTCSIAGCEVGFTTGSQLTELQLDGEGFAGFLFTGTNLNGINSASFRLSSTAGESCFGQIFADVLADGDNDIINTAHTNTKCGVRQYGCFQTNLGNYEEATISTNPYCQNLTLPSGPAYSAGAKIKNSTTSEGNLKMELYSNSWAFLGSCILPRHSQNVQELECIIEYPSAETGNYHLCLKAENSATRYKINVESNNACGCSGVGCSTGTTDFEIFGQHLQFDDVNFVINDSTFAKANNVQLKNHIYDYISDRYLGECQQGCVVPIKFSGGSQALTFSDILTEYTADGILKSSDKIYEVGLEDPALSSSALNIDLKEAEFIIPENTNENSFKLFLDGEQVFSESINITESFSFDVSPRFVSIGIQTGFEASGFGNKNITSSKWEFGDGDIVNSINNKASHRYLEEGEFDLKVTLNRQDNLTSTRTFTVIVGNAREAANETIENYMERLSAIRQTINSYPQWLKTVIGGEIPVDNLESQVEELKSAYDEAESDENYTSIMLDLIELKIPQSLNASRSGELPLIIGFGNIDVSYIEEISSSDSGNSEELKNAIAGWMNENFDGTIDYESISAFYDGGPEVIASKFAVDVIPKIEENSYFIIGYSLQGVTFDRNYNEKSLEGGTYIPLGKERQKISFVIADEVSAQELGIYISPLISELDYESGDIREFAEKGFGWGKFTAGIIILLVAAFIVYILLQEWYKRNYQTTLFKSDEELYNLINFIYNARRTGLNDSQIKLKLKQSKWSGEQITYAIRKLDGRRTGMFEIPLFRSRENKKVREEIMRRQPGTGGFA